jgi:hypothetical protein
VTPTRNVVTAPAATRLTASIVTARPILVKARVSRKCAKNATVMATAYRNAEKVRNAVMANAMTQEARVAVMAKFMTLKRSSAVKDLQLPACAQRHGNAAHQGNAAT